MIATRRTASLFLLGALIAPSLTFAQTPIADGFHLVAEDVERSDATIVSVPTMRAEEPTLSIHATPALAAKEIASAKTTIDHLMGWPQIEIKLTEAGKTQMAAITTEHVSERIALIIDGVCVVAPRINMPLTEGVLLINGNFTVKEARALAKRITKAAHKKN